MHAIRYRTIEGKEEVVTGEMSVKNLMIYVMVGRFHNLERRLYRHRVIEIIKVEAGK